MHLEKLLCKDGIFSKERSLNTSRKDWIISFPFCHFTGVTALIIEVAAVQNKLPSQGPGHWDGRQRRIPKN